MHQSTEYKKIEGFDYEVNVNGDVRRIHKSGTYKILKPALSHGYLRVGLFKDGHEHKRLVHRLIAECFIPNPENKHQVDHINRIRTDNTIANLRWVNNQENNLNKDFKRIRQPFTKSMRKLVSTNIHTIGFNIGIQMVRKNTPQDLKLKKTLKTT